MSAVSRSTLSAAAGIVSLALLIWGYGGEDQFWVAVCGCLFSVPAMLAFGPWAQLEWEHQDRSARWIVPLVWLVALSAASVVWSANRYASLVGSLFCLLLLGVVTAVRLFPPAVLENLLAATVSVVVLAVGYGFGQKLGLLPHAFWHNDQFASRYVNSAHWAALVAATVPIAGVLSMRGRSRAVRWGARGALPLLLVALLLSPSRAVWVIAAAVYTVMALSAIAISLGAGKDRRRLTMTLLTMLLTAGLGLAYYQNTITARFADFTRSKGQSLQQRAQLWRESARLIAAHPFGVGAAGFGEIHLQYKRNADRFSSPYAHNEILQVAAELGWLSVPLMLWFAALLGRDVVRGMRSGSGDGARLTVVGLGAALAVCLMHSLVDFPLRLKANAWCFAILLGALANVSGRSGDGATEQPRLPRVSLGWLLAGCLFTAGWGVLAVSAWHGNQAKQLIVDGNRMGALPYLRTAERWMPFDPDIVLECGRIEHLRASLFPTRSSLWRNAEQSLRQAVWTAPQRAAAHLSLARLLADTGRPVEAETSFREAIRCDPTLGQYWASYGDFLLAQQRYPEAAAAFHGALSAFCDNPDLTPRRVFARLYAATRDPAVLRQACPDRADARRELERVMTDKVRRQ